MRETTAIRDKYDNSISKLLSKAFGEKIDLAKSFLKEYSSDYNKFDAEYKIYSDILNEHILQEHIPLVLRCRAARLRRLHYSCWHCYLVGRIASIKGIEYDEYEDLEDVTEDILFDLKDLYSSVEYLHYSSVINEVEQDMKQELGETKLYERTCLYLMSLERVYYEVWAMMYVLGFRSTEETYNLDRAQQRNQIGQLHKLHQHLNIPLD